MSHESPTSSTAVNGKHEDTESRVVPEQIVEIVSDSGEGAQTAGQMFARLCADAGYSVWTVEIIPAEIEPPARSRAGASGIRIRFGTSGIESAGDRADVVVSFNEQVLHGRLDQDALRPGTKIILESKWADDPVEEIRTQYATERKFFTAKGYEVIEVPMHAQCRKVIDDPRRGKNVWVIGMLCAIYGIGIDKAREMLTAKFAKKGQSVVDSNIALLEAGHQWADDNLDLRIRVTRHGTEQERVVLNGNEAIAMGIMAAGFEVCAMYPITPATSVSHFLAQHFHKVGGFLHQAEDEIAAIGFAIGASYAGKTAVTVTSGPGLALKTEFIGLGVMAEVPLVIVDVQRGGPSTGLPTKVEQSDLLAAIYGQPGDAPKIVLAPATIDECFHFMITARQLAETYRMPVMVLTDANLATGVQPILRPQLQENWFAAPIDQSPWNSEVKSYDWDAGTGLSQRPIPGQPGGEYVLTGLAHDENSKVAYESAINQRGMMYRSRKLAVLQSTLKPPMIDGDPEGDLLVVSWGSTHGAVGEAISRVRKRGGTLSWVHVRFLSPLEPGLREIFSRFKQVLTVEISYGDDEIAPWITADNRRRAQLAWLLRATTTYPVESWSRVPGYPLQPGVIEEVLFERLNQISTTKVS